jgi:polyisoprenoid-binding protein YceI
MGEAAVAMRKRTKVLVGFAVGAVVLATAGPYVYIHFIEGPAPAPLSQSKPGAVASGPVAKSIEGTWKPTAASIVGYRVHEVLFGQQSTAVGRTSSVTGELVATATAVTSASFTVDMATVKSDRSTRDNQFQGRIMNVDQFPTSTFKLTKPIAIASVPTENGVSVTATGELTLHGVTKTVQPDMIIKRNGPTFEVIGALNIVFADWKVSNPSFGPAQTDDRGLLEWSLVFSK